MLWRGAVNRLALFVALGGATLCAASPAQAAGATDGAAGRLTLSVSPVDSSATFGLRTESPMYCPGDAEKGYRWGTFITPQSNDPSSITYHLGMAQGSGTTDVLTDATSTAISNRDPGFGDGFVSPPANIQLAAARYRGLPAGEYRLGVACAKRGTGNVYHVVRYWDAPVVVERVAKGGANGFVIRAAGSAVAGQGDTASPTTEPAVTSAAVDTTVAAGAVMTDAADASTDSVVAEGTTALTEVAPVDPAVRAPASTSKSRGGWWLLWLVVVALLARIGYLVAVRVRARRSQG